MKRPRNYARYTVEATQLLGAQIRLSRLARRWSQEELAERAGISPLTLAKIERGDPSAGLGDAFQVAMLVGVPLFREDRSALSTDLARTRERIAVLPQRIRAPREEVKDDF